MASKNNIRNKQAANNTFHYILLVLLTIFLMLFPKNFGFFNGAGIHAVGQSSFEKYVSYGIIFGLVGLLLAGIHQLRKGEIDQRHILAWVGLLIPLVYYISSFNAASEFLSKILIYYQIGAYGFFVIGILLADSKKILDYLLYVYLFIGTLVIMYSFGYMMGNTYKPDALSFVEGVRIASVFTYSNAYAAFLLTLLLVTLHYLSKVRNRIATIVLGVSLLWVTASLLLTLSRGAMLALPIIVLVTLIISGVRKQLLMCIYMVFAAIGSLIIQSKLQNIGEDTYHTIQQSLAGGQAFKTNGVFSGTSLEGWMTIFAASLLMAALVYLFDRFALAKLEIRVANWEARKYSHWVIPALFALIGICGMILVGTGVLNGLLPQTLAERLSDINFNTHSVLERLTIYQDAVRLWQDHIWLGAGGGAWDALYDQYQSYPYVSSQTHSYPVQVLVETGLLGFVLVGGFMIYILARYMKLHVKQRKSDQEAGNLFLLVALSLLIHSLIDFEMNYFMFTAIVFLALGVLAGDSPQAVRRINGIQQKQWIKSGMGIVMIAVAILAFTYTSKLIYAHNKLDVAMEQVQQQKELSILIQTIESGLDQYPNHPFLLERAGLFYFSAFQQTHEEQYRTEELKYIDRLSKAEPNMRSLNEIYYSDALEVKDYERAAQIMDKAIESNPFEISYYERSISSHYELYKTSVMNADVEKQEVQSKAIEKIYRLAEDRVADLQKLNKAIIIIRPFAISDAMQQAYNYSRQ